MDKRQKTKLEATPPLSHLLFLSFAFPLNALLLTVTFDRYF